MSLSQTNDDSPISRILSNINLGVIRNGAAIGNLIEMLSTSEEIYELFLHLEVIKEFTKSSFSYQENMMKSLTPALFEEHAKHHDALLQQLEGLSVLLELANGFHEVDKTTIVEFLTKWHASDTMRFDGPLIDALAMSKFSGHEEHTYFYPSSYDA